jgi:hypothetical protein
LTGAVLSEKINQNFTFDEKVKHDCRKALPFVVDAQRGKSVLWRKSLQ